MGYSTREKTQLGIKKIALLGLLFSSVSLTGKPVTHAAGGPPAITAVGSTNSDIENGMIKKDSPTAQLYDLEADMNQTENVYNEHPEVVKEMSALLKTYAPPKTPAKRKKKRP